MSKGSTPIKVLRTALKRVTKGWTRQTWHYHNPRDNVNYVCLEGAVYGYCEENKHQTTEAQREAVRILRGIIREKFGHSDIPSFNDDPKTNLENVQEVIKLGIIRLETGGGDDHIDEEDFNDLLEFKDSQKG